MEKICKQHTEESKLQLKTGGLKITPARLCLLDIFKHAKKPMSVKELGQCFGDSNVDAVTLYRNVESLEDLGLLKKIFISNKESYYELESSNHHHHIICKQCGKISDIEGCKVKVDEKDLLNLTGFGKIEGHSLEFFGLCSRCYK